MGRRGGDLADLLLLPLFAYSLYVAIGAPAQEGLTVSPLFLSGKQGQEKGKAGRAAPSLLPDMVFHSLRSSLQGSP